MSESDSERDPNSPGKEPLPPLKHLRRISLDEAKKLGMFSDPVQIVSTQPATPSNPGKTRQQ